MARSKYLNGVLTVIALLLGMLVLDRFLVERDAPVGGSAMAQPGSEPSEGAGLVSAADQRKLMIAELKKISGRLEKIESKLNAGINVKVIDPPGAKPADDKR